MDVRPALSALALGLAGSFLCSSPAVSGSPAFGDYWPNEDGRSWTFDQRTEVLFGTPSTTDRSVRLILDGTAVAPNGIDVQVLRGQQLSGPPVADSRAARITDPFLRAVHAARPDLRAAIEAQTSRLPCPDQAAPGVDGLMLSAELAYRKDATEIAAWRCSFADTRSWIWLEADLSPGHMFTLQLIPDIASDIFLHGTVSGFENVVVPAGVFPSALRVDYRIDYGLGECTDESGNILGTSRSETRGHVHYVAGVGPVSSLEEFIQFAEATGTCAPNEQIGQPSSRVTKRLASLPVAVRRSTWGALKSGYR